MQKEAIINQFNLEQYKITFSIENFEKGLKDYLNNLEDFQNEIHTKNYQQYSEIVYNRTELFEAELKLLIKDVFCLLGMKPKIESVIEYVKSNEENLLKEGAVKIDEGDFTYFVGKLSDNKKKQGRGVYNIQENTLYCGEFENDLFKKGIMIRKTDDNKIAHIYLGTFTKENDKSIFKGVLYPNFENNTEIKLKQVSLIYGKITDETKIEGLTVYSYTGKKYLSDNCEIVWGLIENYQKAKTCLILQQEDDLGFLFGGFVNDKADEVCHVWKKNNYLVQSTYANGYIDEVVAKYFITKNGIYNGNLNFNGCEDIELTIGNCEGRLIYDNNDIFEGDFTQEGFKSEGQYFISDPTTMKRNIKISAKYFNDKIVDTGKVYKLTDEGKEALIFEGTFNEKNEILNGTYYYDEKEKYKGFFKNFMRDQNGEYIFADGSKLFGTWIANKKHGKFLYVDYKGKSTNIEFNMDKQVLKNI